MANPTVIKLQDGNVMPQLGLGVWQASNKEVVTTIQKALEAGYRSTDITAAYENEEDVGKVLKNTSVDKEELLITAKLWNDDHKRPHEALLDSLKKPRLDYIDLCLMHWPVPTIDHYVETRRGMTGLQEEGLTRSIGVCNLQIHHLQHLINETGVTPVANQIELHPLMQQRQLYVWNTAHKIQTESWSSLAQGGKGVFGQEAIRDLADKYGKTPAQIITRWHLDSGLMAVLKSVTPSRIVENFDVQGFRLGRGELGEVARLDQGERLDPDPDQSGGQRASSPGGSNVPLPDFSEIIYSPRVPPVATLPCSGMPDMRTPSYRVGSS